MSYTEKLEAIQSDLPFDFWPNEGDGPDEDEGEGLFWEMIDALIALGEKGDAAAKTEAFKASVLALNRMAEANPGLIEIEEQEDICEIMNEIAAAAGLDTSAYQDGQSIADQWRTW